MPFCIDIISRIRYAGDMQKGTELKPPRKPRGVRPGAKRGFYRRSIRALKRRWRVFGFVAQTFTGDDLRENRMRPRRISWRNRAIEWRRKYGEPIESETLEQRFKRACADPQVKAAFTERRDFVRSWLTKGGWPGELPPSHQWEVFRYFLVHHLRPQYPPRSLWAVFRKPPLDLRDLRDRFYRAYSESPKFRSLFRGELRRAGLAFAARLARVPGADTTMIPSDWSVPNLVLGPLIDWLPCNVRRVREALREYEGRKKSAPRSHG